MISTIKPILFVTTALGTGGAERMLLKILRHLDRKLFSPTVVSLLDNGTVGSEIQALGIPVVCLHIDRSPLHTLIAPIRLARVIHRGHFQLVQGWMYHGNFLAWFGRLLANSRAPLSFGIRQSFYGLAREKTNTRWVIRANVWLSGRVQGCIFNSRFSLETHRAFGFVGKNATVIPNGFDLEVFAPRPATSPAARAGLGIEAELVVGMIARFHPVKAHHDFLQAAAIVRLRHPEVKFLLVGTGVSDQNDQLVRWIDDLDLKGGVLLLDERSDIAELNNIFDVACLVSRAEAFPNVIGEAMACGTPCVVTDVGDCAEIVGKTGRVVPAGEPRLIAGAILDVLEMPQAERYALGQAARLRVEENFSIDRVSEEYSRYFQSLLS